MKASALASDVKQKEFTIVILNYRTGTVKIFKRTMRADIQQEDVEEMLVNEYDFNSDCYFMFGDNIKLEIET